MSAPSFSTFLSSNPASFCEIVTPSDDAVFENFARAIYVGTGGDISVLPSGDGVPVTFKNVPDAFVLPVSVIGVLETGTTASDIVALY